MCCLRKYCIEDYEDFRGSRAVQQIVAILIVLSIAATIGGVCGMLYTPYTLGFGIMLSLGFTGILCMTLFLTCICAGACLS